MSFQRRKVALTGPPDRPIFTMSRSRLGIVDKPLPEDHLPPFSALTRVRIRLYFGNVSGRLANLLSSIHSAPTLSTATFKFPARHSALAFPSSGPWVMVDKWLAWLASDRGETKGGITVTLGGWPDGDSNWERYFPGFRMAGGQLTVEPESTP